MGTGTLQEGTIPDHRSFRLLPLLKVNILDKRVSAVYDFPSSSTPELTMSTDQRSSAEAPEPVRPEIPSIRRTVKWPPKVIRQLGLGDLEDSKPPCLVGFSAQC